MESNLINYKFRTPEELKQQVIHHRILAYSPRRCSICNEPLYFYFYPNGIVTYDSSCSCVCYNSHEHLSNFDSVARCYNIDMQSERAQEVASLFKFKD